MLRQLSSRLRSLDSVQFRIHATGGDQGIVGALFHQLGIFHDEHDIGMPDRVQMVGRPCSANRAPYQKTRQVPIATITSTTGESLALMPLASSAVSTFARL